MAIACARDAVASDEARRLEGLIRLQDLAEPLEVVRATASHASLRSQDETHVDRLRRQVAHSMVCQSAAFLMPLAKAIGWEGGDCSARVIEWRVAMREEALTLPGFDSLDESTWREWMSNAWEGVFPLLLPDLLAGDQEVLCDTVAAITSVPIEDARPLVPRLDPDGWRGMAAVALSTPRAVVATEPLAEAEQAACHRAIYTHFMRECIGSEQPEAQGAGA
jgi:hypothetical protein